MASKSVLIQYTKRKLPRDLKKAKLTELWDYKGELCIMKTHFMKDLFQRSNL